MTDLWQEDENRMDKFIGHLDDGRIQTLEEHLEGTATLAGQFARPFGMEDAGVLL